MKVWHIILIGGAVVGVVALRRRLTDALQERDERERNQEERPPLGMSREACRTYVNTIQRRGDPVSEPDVRLTMECLEYYGGEI